MGTPGLWIGLNAFTLLMLALDLGVFHRRSHAISLGEATAWSVVWVVVSLAFNLGLLHWYGRTTAKYLNRDRKSTRLNSSHGYISYAVFCLKKKNTTVAAIYTDVLSQQ